MDNFIKQNLKKIRKEFGFTQKEIAEKIGITLIMYRKKERGETKFSLLEAYKISKILDKSIEEIFFQD